MTLGPTGRVSFAVLSLPPTAPQQLPRAAPCRPDLDLNLGYTASTWPFPTANAAAAASTARFCPKGKGIGTPTNTQAISNDNSAPNACVRQPESVNGVS